MGGLEGHNEQEEWKEKEKIPPRDSVITTDNEELMQKFLDDWANYSGSNVEFHLFTNLAEGADPASSPEEAMQMFRELQKKAGHVTVHVVGDDIN